jgi:P27 family predicted phage terminase small subunit
MGKRGPQPKPTNLRVLHGDRKDRINTEEPVPRDGLPVCPSGVSDEVKQVWDYTLAELSAMKCATPADRDALLAYCEAVVLHRLASQEIAEGGITALGGNGAVGRAPAVLVQKDAATMIRAFAQEFGLTPAARSQIRMGAGEKSGAGAARLLSG